MDSSRRSFLALGLGTAMGLAGCNTSGISFPGDETTTATTVTTSGSGQTTEQTTTEQTTTEQTTTVQVPALATETSAILDEISWFATDYESAVDSYLGLCEQSIATLEQIARSSTLTDAQLEKVRTAVMRASDYFDAELEAHFAVYGPVPKPHLDEISKFAERGDVDRAHTELRELIDHMEDVSSALFVQRELRRNPIEDHLWKSLAAVKDDSIIFGFKHHTSGFEGWSYPKKPDDFNKLTWSAINEDYREVLGPALNPEGRTDLLSLTLNRVPRSVQWEKNSLQSVPVVVQRYGSRAAAETAFQQTTETTVTLESETEFGRATWGDGYYYFDGDIRYAYFLQVGGVVFAMAPSKTPWDERDDTQVDILKRSWLWS